MHLRAEVSQVLHATQEDIVFGVLRFHNGVLGILDVNWVTPTTVRKLSITGERGMFVVNYLTQELFFHENPAAQRSDDGTTWAHDFTVNEGHMIRFQIDRREPLRRELEAFLEVIKTGQKPLVDGADGLRAVRLALSLVAAQASEGVMSP